MSEEKVGEKRKRMPENFVSLRLCHNCREIAHYEPLLHKLGRCKNCILDTHNPSHGYKLKKITKQMLLRAAERVYDEYLEEAHENK